MIVCIDFNAERCFPIFRLHCLVITRMHAFFELHFPELLKIIIVFEPIASFSRNHGEESSPFICTKLRNYCKTRRVYETLMPPKRQFREKCDLDI